MANNKKLNKLATFLTHINVYKHIYTKVWTSFFQTLSFLFIPSFLLTSRVLTSPATIFHSDISSSYIYDNFYHSFPYFN